MFVILLVQAGTTLVLRDVIRKTESQSIVVTSATKVLIAAAIDVPQEHAQEGYRLLNPPPSEEVKIAIALSSPVKKKLSIAGKIVQV